MQFSITDILMSEHDVLRESMEWGFDSEDTNYYHYVLGVLDLADKLIDLASSDCMKDGPSDPDDNTESGKLRTENRVESCPHTYA